MPGELWACLAWARSTLQPSLTMLPRATPPHWLLTPERRWQADEGKEQIPECQ